MLHVQPPAALAKPIPLTPEPEARPSLRFNYAPGYELPDRHALQSYASWLFYERRLVCMELYPDLPRPDAFVMAGNIGFDWHTRREPGKTWADLPPPSSRALAVLDAVGVDWKSDKSRREGRDPIPLPRGSGAALPGNWPHADAELLSASVELTTLDLGIDGYLTKHPDALEETDPEFKALEDRRWAVLDLLASTPAHTVEGMRVKAEALELKPILDDHETMGAIAASLADDVRRLTDFDRAERAADPDVRLKEVYARWQAKCEEIEAAPDEDQDRLMDELREIETAVRAYPVETLPGLALKAKVAEAFLHADMDIGELDAAERTYQAVFADIARLAGPASHAPALLQAAE